MTIPELSPASPYASLTSELVVIEISDDDSSASDEGDDDSDDKDGAQDDDTPHFEDEHEINIGMSVPKGIDCHMTWEAVTPARHEANPANYTQHATSDYMSDIDGNQLH